VIGAGPAGVHMAWLLKELGGLKDVTILEKSGRVGDWIHTVTYRGVSHQVFERFTLINYMCNIFNH